MSHSNCWRPMVHRCAHNHCSIPQGGSRSMVAARGGRMEILVSTRMASICLLLLGGCSSSGTSSLGNGGGGGTGTGGTGGSSGGTAGITGGGGSIGAAGATGTGGNGGKGVSGSGGSGSGGIGGSGASGGVLAGVTAMSVGDATSCAVASGGAVVCWGDNV